MRPTPIGPTLFKAFCESKVIAFKRMRNMAALRCLLPWLGDDLEANRMNFDTMMRYMVVQGIFKSVKPVESLFVPV
jgi:hypothetical protein